tara:strand:- start:113 stop:472 length:360 start_codon:yes stop_codon:yes gene_type:complete
MKTLLTTIAVLFTMATTASAWSAYHMEDLGECLHKAAIESVASSANISYYEAELVFDNPRNKVLVDEVHEMVHNLTVQTITAKLNQESESSVLNSIDESEHFIKPASKCISVYWILSSY